MERSVKLLKKIRSYFNKHYILDEKSIHLSNGNIYLDDVINLFKLFHKSNSGKKYGK